MSKDILLHQCCGPCSIYPIRELISSGFTPVLFFYNPNIHPIKEFYLRLDNGVKVAEHFGLRYYFDNEYGLKKFLSSLEGNYDDRCSTCYDMRISELCKKAVELRIKYITSSILYSKMQKHQLFVDIATKYAKEHGLEFVYEDFRRGWQNGIDESKQMELYRQNYCGCIFSEEERFVKKNRLPKS